METEKTRRQCAEEVRAKCPLDIAARRDGKLEASMIYTSQVGCLEGVRAAIRSRPEGARR